MDFRIKQPLDLTVAPDRTVAPFFYFIALLFNARNFISHGKNIFSPSASVMYIEFVFEVGSLINTIHLKYICMLFSYFIPV